MHQHASDHASTCQHTHPTLIHLEVEIDVSDKDERGEEGHRAKHKETDIASQPHVAEKLQTLQDPGHVGTPVIVEDGVQQDKNPCGPAHREW